uniref:Medium-chain acyl-CoA ligase ACSF2, mitochondrial n=1 Tax=Dicentrarchus labrax TaxID=13489 RepID=A0A8C4I0D5_DICLA
MSALISSSLLRSYVYGLQHRKTWTLCSTSLLQWCRSLHVDTRPHIPSLTSSYVHGTSSIPLLPLTVSQCLDSTVERWPDREAVVFLQDGIRKNFAQFQQDVDKVAAGLLALGMSRGDRLGVWGPNTYEWILFQFASAKAGIILVSLNPAYQAKEVHFTLKQVQCKAVVCPTRFKTQHFCDMLREICPEIDTSPVGMIKSSRLPDLRMVIVTDSRQPGMLHVEDVIQAGESRHHKELMDLQNKLSFDDAINIQFTSGTTGSPKGATLSHHNIVNNAYFAGLRVGYGWRLLYGTTENSPLTFLGFPKDNEELKLNTVGCIMNHTEAKVVDPNTGEIVPLGTPGELLIRGSCVMHGYWDDPEKTSQAICEARWYRTGDTASLNSLGYCRIEGRMKDMIIRGGENIYPAEIEQFLYTHPKVQEVQVVGVKDERLGEQVCACIRLKEGQTSSTEEIRAFCKGQVRAGDKLNCQKLNMLKIRAQLYSLGTDICFFLPLDFSLQDPTLCVLCRQLPSDSLWKGTILLLLHRHT